MFKFVKQVWTCSEAFDYDFVVIIYFKKETLQSETHTNNKSWLYVQVWHLSEMKSLAKRGRRRRCLLGFGWRVGYRCGLIGGSGEHLYHFFERGKVSFDEGRRVRVGGLESDDGWFSRRRRFVVWEIFGGSDSGLAGDPTRSSDRWWRDVWSYSCSLHLSVQNKTKNQKAINLKVRKTQKKRKKQRVREFCERDRRGFRSGGFESESEFA